MKDLKCGTILFKNNKEVPCSTERFEFDNNRGVPCSTERFDTSRLHDWRF